ncbi:sulfurtransferase [Luteimonas aestuarii]|uniref:Sulfurtransferase n=1 Tax=Luteimonas aestuarii TaxID=453837 RepID=A0A4R5U4V1_9GAMM|nr:sulfurtransferase [Luteimonas aestuarii]
MDWTTLVSPEALQPRLGDDDLVLLDCRGSLADPSAGVAAWRASHLPGARHADMERDLSGPHAAGAGRHPWPDAAGFTAKLSAWGIWPATQVVAYDDGDGAFAARLWFLLHALGHARVAVLDGGWRQWCAQGRPVDGLEPEPRPASYRATFDDTLLVDARGVRAHLDAGGLLLDARAAERFRGEVEPIDRVAGHVPGAINRPYAANLVEGGFKASRVLRAEYEALLDGRDPEAVVAMCGSGVTACHHLLAMAHAGLPGARLFTGSWSGWIEDPARPVSTRQI